MVATTVLVGAGVAAVGPELVRQTETVSFDWPAGTTRLEVTSAVGEVMVREDPSLTPSIELEKTWAFEVPSESIETSDGVTRVTLDCARAAITRCNGDWAVAVPPGTDVVVTTTAGDVDVEGVSGTLAVSNNVGDVRVSGTPTSVDLRSNVGSVVAELDAAPDLVRVRTNVGDVDVNLPPGQSYAVQTRSDVDEVDTTVEVDPDSDHVVDLQTDLGTIRVSDD